MSAPLDEDQATELADLLRRSLDADGQVRDEASPALRRVRQRIRDLRRDLVKRLEAYFGAPNADTTFQERYVTVRHGRYVLPIRAEAKSRLRGIVHKEQLALLREGDQPRHVY